ncbi:MAG: hypothetical protein GY806_11900 [Gammaproteobacteria bacterium]|nr:hypothetical protein [Gammaproteobacteria bacterium]
MVNSKTGIKVSIISALFLVGSAIPAAQADHNSHSILPYIAVGIFASILNNHSHSHRYSYKRKRHHRHSGHSNYGHGGHSGGHYSSNYQHNHNQGGYHYKRKKH